MRLIVLNCSHDEALAAHSPYYTPTRAAVRTEAMLVEQARAHIGPDDLLLEPGCRIDWAAVDTIDVWGWDYEVRERLRRLGAPERLLPSDSYIDGLRLLSSRHTAVALLPMVRADVAETFGESRIVGSLAEAEAYCRQASPCVFKAPWSCSGRGLTFAREALTPEQANRLRRTIDAQGSVVAEPFYAHESDFAIEFTYADGRLTMERVNTFRCNGRGQYAGNLHEPPPVAPDLLRRVADSLAVRLPALLGNGYSGPLGVDMMAADGKVHPCVEVNLRNTMGRFPEI